MLQPIMQVYMANFRQASRRGDHDESLGTKQLYQITHHLVSGWGRFRCCQLTCHQTGISFWERLLWKQSTSGSWNFSIDMSFINLVDCNPSMLNCISCRKWFCFLNGAVAKNRTITKPACQVRRLSRLKPAPLIYLYLFVCSATKLVPSFVEAWLCYAHGCTFLALLFMTSPSPLAWH